MFIHVLLHTFLIEGAPLMGHLPSARAAGACDCCVDLYGLRPPGKPIEPPARLFDDALEASRAHGAALAMHLLAGRHDQYRAHREKHRLDDYAEAAALADHMAAQESAALRTVRALNATTAQGLTYLRLRATKNDHLGVDAVSPTGALAAVAISKTIRTDGIEEVLERTKSAVRAAASLETARREYRRLKPLLGW